MPQQEFQQELVALEPALLQFAKSMTSKLDDAQDLLQETYLRALTFKDSYQPNTNLKAWTFTIMRNTFINSYRKLSRKNTTLDDSENQWLLNGQEASDKADARVASDELNRAIDRLADEFRIPFQMHTHGYKYREIAQELDLCIGTVKSRIFFSRQKLQGALSSYAESRSI